MVAMAATTVDMVEAAGAVMAEMIASVAVPGMPTILVPKTAIVAPIAVNKRAVIAVIIAIIIVGSGPWDPHTDADRSDTDSGTNLGVRGCRTNQRQRKNRSYQFLHRVFL
jgi:hypothetical protein